MNGSNFVKVHYFSRMITTVIIGSGNVATHLLQAFLQSNTLKVIQCFNRKEITRDDIPVTADISQLQEADVYVIAVSDDAIAEIASQIHFSGKLVVHTSGSVGMDALHPKNRRGVLYPLQTFSKERNINYSEIPFCIEAENEDDYLLLEKLVTPISSHVFRIDSEKRRKLHLAAVFVCNFVNHLYQIGYEITEANDLSFDLLKPLIKETAAKIETAVPKDLQTGPAKRNDQKTMAKHLEMLALPEQKQIYKLLSQAIATTDGRKKL